jgi:hypothetical protein
VPAIAYAVGSGAGAPAEVRVFDATGKQINSITNVFPGFPGGVNVAVGDVNNDGTPDIVVGAGPGGGPQVKVFDGAALLNGTVRVLFSFMAYDVTFHGGVNVTVGDTNLDGFGDIITGAGAGGGPHVKVFSGKDLSVLASFFAYTPSFTGGVTVAASDLGGDNGGTAGSRKGSAEIVTGAGPGGGPHVKVFDTHTTPGVAEVLASFMAYDINFRGGVNVAAGFVTNNRDTDNFLFADIITGAGGGGGPHVEVWRLLDAGPKLFSYFLAASYFAFPAGFLGGARVAVSAADLNGDTNDDIIAGAGPGGGPQVDARAGQSIGDLVTFTPAVIFDNFAFPATFNNGIFVG